MICASCNKVGIELEKSFTKAERMILIGAMVSFMRAIEKSPKIDRNDLVVASSILTKAMLSFTEESRNILVEHFKKSLGMEIKIGDCPHSISVVR